MIHETEIKEALNQYEAGILSTQDAILFIDFLKDEMDCDEPQSVYDAFNALSTTVSFDVVWSLNYTARGHNDDY